MECLECVHLEQVFQFRLSDYCEARFSAFYQVCSELAAKKNVDMERARYDLEEHQSICLSRHAGTSEGASEARNQSAGPSSLQCNGSSI
jgi:hypothetical protein